MNNLSKRYYFDTGKNIRDLIHGYVNLTKFELKIIDTIHFQRLKDVRQLTCQEVYPSARHTRFEHSLGVLELTKKALDALNKNGFLDSENKKEKILLDDLVFNVRIAALLHDVGHCPFSHSGENEFDPEDVRKYFLRLLKNKELNFSPELIKKFSNRNITREVAIHEILSCIVLLECYRDMLENLNVVKESDEDSCNITVDFELIVRCILGITYDISYVKVYKNNSLKNACVNLINSKIFDMDKLDYIMRDSFLTGIGAPQIDTERLFENMYLDKSYNIIFTRKAVPALQNMIDARDELYMYVYNHHAVVLSDFFYTYIIRKLSHNAESFVNLIYSTFSKKERMNILDTLEISRLGLIPKSYLFSVGSIIEQNRSDSDWISLINVIYGNQNLFSKEQLRGLYEGEIKYEIQSNNKFRYNKINKTNISSKQKDDLFEKIYSTFQLIKKYKNRDFLKPWWKTVYEFSSFINYNFRDDLVRNTLCKWLCSGGEFGLDASEFRSEIAKQVINITEYIFNNISELKNDSLLLEPLHEGDFFIVQRSNRFFTISSIEKLNIALKKNDIIESCSTQNKHIKDYFLKNLTKIIPQKDYSAIYAKDGFYVYSKELTDAKYSEQQKKQHYEFIERIFVEVSKKFVKDGEQTFVEHFQRKIADPHLQKQFIASILQELNIKENIQNEKNG